MRKLISGFIATLLLATPASAGEFAPDNTAKSLIVDAISQVFTLADRCPDFKINENRLGKLMIEAGLVPTDFGQGGTYFGPFLYSRNFATEIVADMSIKGYCYHLKIRFGPEGETIENLVIPAK